MSYFHMTVSSFGHPNEPVELGNNQPMSSWNYHVVNPDTVAPRQQDITLLDNGGHHDAYIGMQSSGVHTVDTDAMDKTFLFSTICFQSMAHAFQSCNLFKNAIYDIFGHANDKRTENITQPEGRIHGQPFFSEEAVSTVDFTDGLLPVKILLNKEEQTRQSTLSSHGYGGSGYTLIKQKICHSTMFEKIHIDHILLDQQTHSYHEPEAAHHAAPEPEPEEVQDADTCIRLQDRRRLGHDSVSHCCRACEFSDGVIHSRFCDALNGVPLEDQLPDEARRVWVPDSFDPEQLTVDGITYVLPDGSIAVVPAPATGRLYIGMREVDLEFIGNGSRCDTEAGHGMAGPDTVIDVPPAPQVAQPTTIKLSVRTWYYMTIQLISFSVEQLGIQGDESIPIKRLVRSYLPWIPTPLLRAPLVQTALEIAEARRRRTSLQGVVPPDGRPAPSRTASPAAHTSSSCLRGSFDRLSRASSARSRRASSA